MAFLYRWLLRLFLGLAAFIGLALAIAYWVASRSLPYYGGTYSVAGLTGPVEIVRTNANVPHIFAEADADVYFGLGFAHAQDRLWQMTMLRRAAQGRMSELFGPGSLPWDSLARRLDLYGRAVTSVAAQDPYTTAALDAYARGVNAWLAEVNEGAFGRGAPEFFFFTNAMAPWQPADSLAILKLLAWRQSAHATDEVRRARASLVLPAARLRDLLPDVPGPGIAALPAYAGLFPGTEWPILAEAVVPNPPASTWGGASNAWAAGRSRSASGATILANDPHLPFSAPSLWYLARLDLASGGVIGATVPGIPVVLLGRSEGFAWGLASAWIDDQDIAIEQRNPANTNEVASPSGWRPIQRRATIIEVLDAPPVTISVK